QEALAGYEASDEDVIKSQTGFAMYDSQNGWVGNLTYMEPGKGYMLYRKAATDATLYYGSLGGSLGTEANRGIQQNRYKPRDVFAINGLEAAVPGNFKYAENMTSVAEVDGVQQLLPGDVIQA